MKELISIRQKGRMTDRNRRRKERQEMNQDERWKGRRIKGRMRAVER